MNGLVVEELKFSCQTFAQLFLAYNNIVVELLDDVKNSHLLQIVANTASI